MMIIIIVIIVVPCPSSSSLVPCHRSVLPVSVCGHQLSFVGCGRWWSWFVVHFVICGWSSLFVGSCLCFLSGYGGSVVVGGHWHLWMVMKGSGGDKHGWQW